MHRFYGLDLHDFFTGKHPANKLASLVDFLSRHRTSYLSWAMSRDTELYRHLRRHGTKNRAPAPESFDMGLAEDMLSGLIVLMQHLIHAVRTHGTRTRKRPRITPWPRPVTAAHLVDREDTRAAYAHIESLIVYSDEPYT